MYPLKLHQYVALTYCYQCIVIVWGIIPLIIILLPILGNIIFPLIDYIASGYGTVGVILSYIGIQSSHQFINYLVYHHRNNNAVHRNTSTTTTNNNNNNKSDAILRISMAKNQKRIIFFMVLLSCFMCRTIIGPMLDYYLMISTTTTTTTINHKNIFLSLSWFIPSFRICFRIAMVLFALSSSVIFRYIGPVSIMRCSNVPLVTNPFRIFLKKLWNYPSTFLQPGDNPSELLSFRGNWNTLMTQQQQQQPLQQQIGNRYPPTIMPTTTTTPIGAYQPFNPFSSSSSSTAYIPNKPFVPVPIVSELVGRRFQEPSIKSLSAQMIVALIIGVFVSYIGVPTLDYTDDRGNDLSTTLQSLIISISVLSIIAPILLSSSDAADASSGTYLSSHEVNPHIYLYPFSNQLRWRNKFQMIMIRSFSVALVVPLIGIVLNRFMGDSSHENQPTRYIDISIGCQLMLFSFSLYAYLCIFDEIVKVYVIRCQKFGLKRFVDERKFDFTYKSTLDVVLHSILSDTDLVQAVYDASPIVGPNRNESLSVHIMDRNELMNTTKLMHRMSDVMLSVPIHQVEACFEEDVLRIILLESLGGIKDPSMIHDTLSSSHYHETQRWLAIKKDEDVALHSTIAITLVRGLAVYVGGFGEALSTCSKPVLDIHGIPSIHNHLYTWILSHTAILNVQFALRALSRLIVQCVAPNGQIHPDWTSTTLAIMVPSVLTAIYSLRTGVLDYLKYSNSRTGTITTINATPTGGSSMESTSQKFSNHHHNEIYKLVQISDTVARTILYNVNPNNSSTVKLELFDNTMEWLRALTIQKTSISYAT